MSETTNIEFKITEYNNYITTVHNAIGGEMLEENTLFFSKNHFLLSGTVKMYPIRDGLRVLISKEFFLKKPLTLIRSSDENNAFIVCKIYLSSDKDSLLQEGVLLNSSSERDINELPVGQTFTTISFIYQKQWFKDYLQLQENDNLNVIFAEKFSFSIFEKLPSPVLKVVKEIVQFEFNNTLDKLAFDNKVIEFVLWSLKVLEQHTHPNKSQNWHKQDLDSVNAIHQMLIENLDKSLPIYVLAKEAGMSESKLKVIFKQVYGTSIHQYIINCRMTKAYQMLLKEKRTIGEVSTALGYANQSRFTQTFKEYFAILPTEVFKTC